MDIYYDFGIEEKNDIWYDEEFHMVVLGEINGIDAQGNYF